MYKEDLWQEPDDWQRRLWLIGNCQLRSYRLKLLYKDIFSNERRFRFGLSDSPNCVGCGQIETISHQLLECDNAKRLWDMYHRITGKTVDSLLQIIVCTEPIEIEIIKSIIIKRLIQIDRSRHCTLASIKQEIRHYFRLEACLSRNSDRQIQFWQQCLSKVGQA